MLDEKQFEDLREIFPVLVLFGEPAQLARSASRRDGVRQAGAGAAPDAEPHSPPGRRQPDPGPGHALADDQLSFDDFEQMIRDAARKDDAVVWAERVESDLMARSPVLVWRNATRIRLILPSARPSARRGPRCCPESR